MYGQPTKYREEYCESLIRWMAKGKSYITWGPRHDPRISVRTMYLWEEKHPEWKEAKETGYALGLAHFESLLQAVMMGIVPEELKAMGSKRIDLTSIIFTLKTRFHKQYGDLQKVEYSASTTPLEVNFVDDKDQLEDNSGDVIEIEKEN